MIHPLSLWELAVLPLVVELSVFPVVAGLPRELTVLDRWFTNVHFFSGFRGSRASETNTADREAKRVRFTESRGQKRQGEDVEELAAKAKNNILMQMLRCLHTRHGELKTSLRMRRMQRRTNERLCAEQDGGVRED